MLVALDSSVSELHLCISLSGFVLKKIYFCSVNNFSKVLIYVQI